MPDVDAPVVADAPTTEAPAADPAPQTIADAAKGSVTPPKTPGPAPWSKDLEDMGLDPDTLVKVDSYMREKIQPRTTQLEQKASEYDKLFSEFTTTDGGSLDPTSAAQMASELLSALATDPESAVREIMNLMQLDPAKFAQVQEQMEEQSADPQTDAEAEELTWVQEQMRREKEAKEDAAWQEHLKEQGEKIPGFNQDLYTMAMAAVGPDPDTVMEWYMRFHQAPAPTPEASVTLGEAGPTPPEAPTFGSIRDAVKGYVADNRAASRG